MPYELEEVDFTGGMPDEQQRRHPFGKVPALRHGDFLIYETTAICRYVDEAFDGPAMQPNDPRQRARMNQITAIIDAYLSEHLRKGLIAQLLFRPEADQVLVAAARVEGAHGLAALAEITDGGPFLVGNAASLADFHLAPLFAYLEMFEIGVELIAGAPDLLQWWQAFRDQPALAASRAPSGLTAR